jgi:hypothetical protein
MIRLCRQTGTLCSYLSRTCRIRAQCRQPDRTKRIRPGRSVISWAILALANWRRDDHEQIISAR